MIKEKRTNKKLKKNFSKRLKNLTEIILDQFRSGSPLNWSQTKQLMYGFTPSIRTLSKKEIYGHLERIRKQGWLEKKIKEDQIYYSLTKEGRIKQMMFKLRHAQRQRGVQATIIIFDIPEEKRTFRNFLRRLLNQIGFTMIQKSVFLTPYILSQDFYNLMKEMDLLKYLMVIEGQIRFRT